MARQFIQLKNNNVVGEIFSDRLPGDGKTLPNDMLEVTARKDGPWLGKLYDPNTDTFSIPEPPPPTKGVIEITRLITMYEDWRRWKNTRLEMEARGENGKVVDAALTRENSLWDAYRLALSDWDGAS